MRIAIAGKGGTGKTTTSGILCRALARRGRSVLAVDADSNPNLAAMVGVDPSGGVAPALPRDLMRREEAEDGTRRLVLTRPVEEVLDAHAAAGPDGIRLMVMERVGHGGAG